MKGSGSGISQTALGRALNLSPAAVTKLKGQGMPVYSVEAARAWRIERQSVARRKPEQALLPQTAAVPLAHAAQPSPPAPPPYAPPPQMGEGAYRQVPDYNTSRARREAAEAHLAELRLAEERGELVRASAMRAAVSRRAAGLREALLQLPARVVPMLVASPDAASMDQILRAEIVAALAQLTETAE